MKIKDYLGQYVSRSESFINKYFSQKKKEGNKIDPEIGDILDTFSEYSRGGKKLRGALTLLGYELAGGKKTESIIPVSCGIELFHNFLLIHDDIIDNDKLRRGKPTIHNLYSKIGGEHFGISKAITIGDVGAFLGYELIITSPFPKEKIVKAISMLNTFLTRTVYGEILDIEYDLKKEISWNDIIKVRTYKTAYYTFILPLTVGACFGGGSEKMFETIVKFGEPLGIAFQLVDDVLGVFGDEKKTGKSNKSDIEGGKKTLLYAKALELADPVNKKYLLNNYGKAKLGNGEVERIRKIFKETGAVDYSLNLAKKLVKKAKSYISSLTKNSDFTLLLSELSDYMILRDK